MQIVNAYIEECPACRLIGRRYTPADSMQGSFGHKWGEWWKQNLFAPLDALPHLPIVGDSTMAAMRVVEGELEYWIGFPCHLDTPIPDGYEAAEFGPCRFAVLWLQGNEKNGELYGLAAHKQCLERLREMDWKRRENDWCIERYNCPRFTVPDENGQVILDYCIAVE